ncbi:hypothetical protein V6R21_22740 [Limibacter armeniacum]|uniref:hypothetical protein n=1 Tax=Limibacter armeniacum TaxID=466084 RepID=UPI002FE67EAA
MAQNDTNTPQKKNYQQQLDTFLEKGKEAIKVAGKHSKQYYQEYSPVIQESSRKAISSIKASKVSKWQGWGKIGKFTFQEVLATTAGWSAGLFSSQLVHQYYEKKSIRNLWGLAANKSKKLVTKDEFQNIEEITSYIVGLVILLIVQFLIKKLFSWYRNRKTGEFKEVFATFKKP